MIVLIFVLLLISTNVGLFVRRYTVGRVDGGSMQRAFQAGDRLIAESLTYRFRKPLIGEVVVAYLPGGTRQKILKRIAAGPGAAVSVQGQRRIVGAEEWFLLGDNLDGSTDSRHFGPVRTKDILARVWFRY